MTLESIEAFFIKLEAQKAILENGVFISTNDSVENYVNNLICIHAYDLALKLAHTQSNHSDLSSIIEAQLETYYSKDQNDEFGFVHEDPEFDFLEFEN